MHGITGHGSLPGKWAGARGLSAAEAWIISAMAVLYHRLAFEVSAFFRWQLSCLSQRPQRVESGRSADIGNSANVVLSFWSCGGWQSNGYWNLRES
jgi:hypothetical protein